MHLFGARSPDDIDDRITDKQSAALDEPMADPTRAPSI
jgi:hypothetical protein